MNLTNLRHNGKYIRRISMKPVEPGNLKYRVNGTFTGFQYSWGRLITIGMETQRIISEPGAGKNYW
jgi:hypothetical protein